MEIPSALHFTRYEAEVIFFRMLKEILYWFVICRLVEVYAGNLYFRKSQCNLSYEFVYENTSCYAKSYSRNISTFNYNIVFKKPLKNLWVS